MTEEYISQWQILYDETHHRSTTVDDLGFNIIGWNSSYTGTPIVAEEMKIWVDETVNRIQQLRPDTVMEIGCGTGLLLRRIAPNCSQYQATDFSAEVLTFTQRLVQTEDGLEHVRIVQKKAENFEGVDRGCYDTVILNSVVQYFPDVDYLLRVLEGAIRTLKPGSSIFVGDVRSLPLLDAYHTSVQLYQAAPSTSREQLRNRIQWRVKHEEELVIDPAFFVALRKRFPRISHVDVLLKRGRYHNELTRFRYDVVLHVEKDIHVIKDIPWQNWQMDKPTVTDVRRLLIEKQPAFLGLRGVSNLRLHDETRTVDWLQDSYEDNTTADWRKTLSKLPEEAIDPEDFWRLGDELSYDVSISCSTEVTDGSYDVLFKHRKKTESGVSQSFVGDDLPFKPWNEYTNNPLLSKRSQSLVVEIRRFLESRLVDYMVPSVIMILDAWPLTANGKIDRRALPVPNPSRLELSESFVPPRTPLEEDLAGIWKDVLGVEEIGIYDNFFEIGGHSLMATQLMFDVAKTFQIELPLRTLFENPTVADLARELSPLQNQVGTAAQLPAIVPDPKQRYAPFPLTDIQQAYWVGRDSEFELGNIATSSYMEYDAIDLDLKRINQAWNLLIKRHDMLRAIISPDGQQQILERVPSYEIEVLDLREQDPQVIKTELDTIRERMSQQILPADQWPLFEIRATRIKENCLRLHFSFDALILDAWSKVLVFGEWSVLYRNLNASLAPLDLSYRDWVLAEVSLRESNLYQKSLKYWKARIKNLPPAPELPLAKNPGELKNPRFLRRAAGLEPQRWNRLKNRAAQQGLTPTGVLLAAFVSILKVWSKNPRFTINLTLFNRLPRHPQVNDIAGDFSSSILLAVNNVIGETFQAQAKDLQLKLLDDLDHRYVSGVAVLRELAKERKYHGALMPVVFTSLLGNDNEQKNEDSMNWIGDRVYVNSRTSQVWLDHGVKEKDGELRLIWNTIDELFPTGLVDDMFRSYTVLLHCLSDNADSWQESWPETARKLLPPNQLEQRTMINDTAAPLADDLLQALFDKNVGQQPDGCAVAFGHRKMTYHELRRCANQVAHWLSDHDVQPNTLVAVVMAKGWEQIVAVLGVVTSGAAYLPVDPGLPRKRLCHLLAHGQVKLVLTQSELEQTIAWPDDITRFCLNEENLRTLPDTSPPSISKTEDLAYVIYTSGSTGLPKGVMVDHRGAVNTIQDINRRFEVNSEDRVFALSSLGFDLSVYDVFGTLAVGAAIIIPGPKTTRDPAAWVSCIHAEKVTIWNSVPALMALLVEFVEDHPECQPLPLRLVLLSGDWIPIDLPARVKRITANAHVISLGGATEASIWSIIYRIGTVSADWSSIPYGMPLTNQRFHVLKDDFTPCPVWVPGQLYIGGIGLAKGYWRDAGKTKTAFIRHPYTGERLYRTGDIGRYLPDGNIEFLGRQDFQVKLHGNRVELGEIETALERIPSVRDAVVATIGEILDEKQLIAYLVPQKRFVLDNRVIRRALQETLPGYMIPSIFVHLDDLPLTVNGKVDRNALPAPKSDGLEDRRDFFPELNLEDERISDIVANILRIKEINPETNLLDLGATSVDIIRIINRIERDLDVRPGIDSIYANPTVVGLIERIREKRCPGNVVDTPPSTSLVQMQVGNPELDPMFFVHPGIGAIHCYRELAVNLGPEQPFYGLQSHGLDPSQEAHTCIHDMAACYVELILQKKCDKPHILGGWSLGGVIAFEMAQQLRSLGEDVKFLILVDSDNPSSAMEPVDDNQMLKTFARSLRLASAEITDDPRRNNGQTTIESLEELLRQAKDSQSIVADFELSEIVHMFRIFSLNVNAEIAYVPQRYAGPMTLINAEKSLDVATRDDSLGWGAVVNGPLTIHKVSGDHYNMMQEPDVAEIAKKIKQILETQTVND